MSILGFILMIAAGAGALVGVRMSKAGNAQGAAVAVPCVILAVGLAVAGLLTPNDYTPKLAKSLNHYGYACGVTLGEYLAEHHPGERVLLLVQPSFAGQEPDLLQVAIEEGLRTGIGSALDWVGTVPADPPPAYRKRAEEAMRSEAPPEGGWPECMIPFEMRDYHAWFTPRYLARLFKQHQGTYDVLVSAVGLPRGFPTPNQAKSPIFPQTLAVLNAHGLPMRGLIQYDVVDVLVASKPSINPWKDAQNAPRDTAEAFDKRFLLVTKANLEELVQAYPKSPHWQ